ncbi:hypothetical protein F4777DRAFT_39743 [Nemania sp. FL0916]|nr:hypothetical protein F4777DRAFT_39743 [Nemania sp. FL0916]
MRTTDFNAQRFWTAALLWSGLFCHSLCDDAPPGVTETELLILGSPPAHESTETLTSTVTVTQTIAYKPTLVPGNSQYTLLGCYAQSSGDGGHVFGPDGLDVKSNNVGPDNLTTDGCLRGCRSAAPPSDEKGVYVYAGLQDGSECICGLRLATDARELSPDDCTAPCPGNASLSCGGRDSIAIYSLISASSTGKVGAESEPELEPKPESKPTPLPSSMVDSAHKGAAFEIADSNDASTSFEHTSKPASSSTVGAIAGTLSAAVVLAAVVFLCYRARKRKNETHGNNGQVPAPIATTAHVHQGIDLSLARPPRNARSSPAPDRPRRTGYDDRLGNNQEYGFSSGAIMPTTPALESGGKFPPGLHARTSVSGASGPRRTSAEAGGSLYPPPVPPLPPWSGSGPGGLRSAPTSPRTNIQPPPMPPPVPVPPGVGASSAVQWRSPHPSVSAGPAPFPLRIRERAPSSSGVLGATAPGPAPAPVPTHAPGPVPPASVTDVQAQGLGDRAWHHRKLSTPYPPTQQQQPPPLPPPVSVNIFVAEGAGAAVASSMGRGAHGQGQGYGRGRGGGREITTDTRKGAGNGAWDRNMPRNGPPSAPLPPTPPAPTPPPKNSPQLLRQQQQQQLRALPRSGAVERSVNNGNSNDRGLGLPRAPGDATRTALPAAPIPGTTAVGDRPQLRSRRSFDESTLSPRMYRDGGAQATTGSETRSASGNRNESRSTPQGESKSKTRNRSGSRSKNTNTPNNNKASALGISHPNASTPTLGRYGSLSKRDRPDHLNGNNNTFIESPVLGWPTNDGRRPPWVPPPRSSSRGTEQQLPKKKNTGIMTTLQPDRGDSPVLGIGGFGGDGFLNRDIHGDREPTIPVLPPIAPGERFDHKRWRGTPYAQSPTPTRAVAGGTGGDDERSPVSASSVGTSILFPLEEFDRSL